MAECCGEARPGCPPDLRGVKPRAPELSRIPEANAQIAAARRGAGGTSQRPYLRGLGPVLEQRAAQLLPLAPAGAYAGGGDHGPGDGGGRVGEGGGGGRGGGDAAGHGRGAREAGEPGGGGRRRGHSSSGAPHGAGIGWLAAWWTELSKAWRERRRDDEEEIDWNKINSMKNTENLSCVVF